MRPCCSKLRPTIALRALFFVLFLSQVCVADPGTVTLKTGEVFEVEVLDLEFGRLVNVKFEDGTVKTILWEELEDLK